MALSYRVLFRTIVGYLNKIIPSWNPMRIMMMELFHAMIVVIKSVKLRRLALIAVVQNLKCHLKHGIQNGKKKSLPILLFYPLLCVCFGFRY